MINCISPRRAAEVLDVSTRTVYRMIADGLFVALSVRGSLRITRESLDRYQKLQIDNFLESGNSVTNEDR